MERSWALVNARPALSPVSLIICCVHNVGGRHLDLCHPGWVNVPSRISQAVRRMVFAGTSSAVRATWPKNLKRGRRTTSSMCSWPEISRTSALRVKSNNLMLRMRRWQRVWNDSSFRHSEDVNVQDSQPYSKTDRIQHEYKRNLVASLRFPWRQILSRRFMAVDAMPMRRAASGNEFAPLVWVEPR